MRKSLHILIVFSIVNMLTIFPSKAIIVGEYCIKSIGEVLEHLPVEGPTVAALDWDQTISAKGTQTTPLREGDKTKTVINAIEEKGVNVFVLTARLMGLSKAEPSSFGEDEVSKNLDESVKGMNNQGLGFLEHGALTKNEYEEFRIPQTNTHVMIQDQIVFAGSLLAQSAKPYALMYLIDNNKLKIKPNNIIFVDDDKKQIDAVKSAFANRPEKVTLCYYPINSSDCGQ